MRHGLTAATTPSPVPPSRGWNALPENCRAGKPPGRFMGDCSYAGVLWLLLGEKCLSRPGSRWSGGKSTGRYCLWWADPMATTQFYLPHGRDFSVRKYGIGTLNTVYTNFKSTYMTWDLWRHNLIRVLCSLMDGGVAVSVASEYSVLWVAPYQNGGEGRRYSQTNQSWGRGLNPSRMPSWCHITPMVAWLWWGQPKLKTVTSNRDSHARWRWRFIWGWITGGTYLLHSMRWDLHHELSDIHESGKHYSRWPVGFHVLKSIVPAVHGLRH